MRHLALLAALLTLPSFAATAAAQRLEAETIYHGGTIITVDEDAPRAEAVAVWNGRIIAIGSEADVMTLAGSSTRRVDLAGQTLLPGFYDNHIHLGGDLQEWRGGMVDAIPEWIYGADTLEKVQEAIRQQATVTPAGEWIEGALAREEWPNQKIPTRWELDAVAPDHPVALTRGPHTIILNSRAFELAGITSDTPDPPGGWIIRDERGEPSGRLLEGARRLVEPFMPPNSVGSRAELILEWRHQLIQLRSLGMTSVNMAGLRPTQLRLLQALYARNPEELPRMTAQVRLTPGYDTHDDPELGAIESIEELQNLAFHTGFGNDHLKIGAIKMSIDGGLSAPVLWTLEPYAMRPNFHGVQRIPAETFYQVAKVAHDMGWQLGIHAIGDAASVMVVNELEKVIRENPRANHRHFLHHLTVKPPEETLRKMADLGLMVATHPSWTTALGGFAAEALSGDKLETQNPAKSLMDRGITISFGSDAAPYGPLFNIWNAVTRQGWGDRVYGPEEAVSVEEAIRLHTLGSAYFTFDEDNRGSIEVGKLADFVILAQDPTKVPADDIWTIPVVATVIGGHEFRN